MPKPEIGTGHEHVEMLTRAGHERIDHGAVDLQRFLHRRNAHGGGGGTLTYDGSALRGTRRYIWIPAGAGNGAHYVLWDGVSDANPWSIPGISGWHIVYATLTDAEWSSTGRVNLEPSRFTVQSYNTYVPAENHLVLAWRNSDEARLYLADGRVLDYWHTATYQNGWVSYGAGYAPARYYKDGNGVVHLDGLVKSGTLGSSTAIFTLPGGYRPAYRRIYNQQSNSASARLDVDNGGGVFAMSGSNAWFSLAGVSFPAEQ